MESRDDSPRRLRAPPRCRLCQFALKEDENIVLALDPTRTSDAFTYSSENRHLYRALQTEFTPCTNMYSRHQEKVVGSCHRRCFGITLSNPSHEFLESTDYTFEPDPSEDARRHYRFRTLLALRLAKLYGKLPNEIWLMVSKHLIYECAASVGQALWRTRDALKSYDRMIDVSLDVWARYICIDGVRYVAALSNEDDGRGDMSIISTGGIADDKLPRINTIYVLENHMGLRQVIFATSKELSKLPTLEDAQPGFWWRTISMESRKLQVKSDGIKLRTIAIKSPYACSEIVRWPAPISPSRMRSIRSVNFRPKIVYTSVSPNTQMVYITCNKPGITGYSACWQSRLLTLHAHYDGEDGSSHEKTDSIFCGFPAKPIWIYLPINSGERISRAWASFGEDNNDMAISLVTNKGRMLIGGPYRGHGDLRPSWYRLSDLPDGPTQLYFNSSQHGIRRIAIYDSKIGSNDGDDDDRFQLPAPISRGPVRRSLGDNFYSGATLSGAVQVSVCRIKHAAHSYIAGLLLRYSNGDRVCLGEVCPASAGPWLEVGSSESFWVGTSEMVDLGPYVARIELDPPDDMGQLRWTKFPWKGKLDWWFTYSQSKLFHESGVETPGELNDMW